MHESEKQGQRSVSAVETRLTETANVWLIREREGRADREELSAWLAACPAHADAYRRAARVYAAVEVPATKVGQKRSVLARGRVAACASVVLVLWGAWLARDLPLRLTSEVTDVGESRALTLPDSSRVELNTNSAVSVDYSGPLREVRLKRGEAWFAVAHNPDRPFVVLSGNTRVTVLGTKFNVRRTDNGVAVTVAEGRVEVRQGMRAMLLTPGRGVVVTGQSFAPSDQNVSHVAEWRSGWAGFEHATLGEVIDELSRYHRGPLIIVDDEVRRRPISARLDVRAPDRALQTALQAASARLISLPGGVRIIF